MAGSCWSPVLPIATAITVLVPARQSPCIRACGGATINDDAPLPDGRQVLTRNCLLPRGGFLPQRTHQRNPCWFASPVGGFRLEQGIHSVSGQSPTKVSISPSPPVSSRNDRLRTLGRFTTIAAQKRDD